MIKTQPHDDDIQIASVGPITTHAAPLGKLARSIDLPPQTMNALCGAGLGPPTFKIGRRRYSRLSDFNDWLDQVASGEVEATMASPKRRHLAADETPSQERNRRRKVGPKPRKLKVSADKGEAARRPADTIPPGGGRPPRGIKAKARVKAHAEAKAREEKAPPV